MRVPGPVWRAEPLEPRRENDSYRQHRYVFCGPRDALLSPQHGRRRPGSSLSVVGQERAQVKKTRRTSSDCPLCRDPPPQGCREEMVFHQTGSIGHGQLRGPSGSGAPS